jgi:hypothetical protein
MRQEVSAVTRTYDFVLWLLPHIAGFARRHRFTLGDRLEGGVLEVLELLVEASYTRDKRALLQRANLRLERVRYLIRLAVDLKLLTVKPYEFAARAIVTIGGEIGGWTRHRISAEVSTNPLLVCYSNTRALPTGLSLSLSWRP